MSGRELSIAARKLPFGKYQGSSLKDILNFDRGYLEWLVEQKWVNLAWKTAIRAVLASDTGTPE